MKRYVLYDESGNITGEIVGSRPPYQPHIEITLNQSLVNKKVVSGVLVDKTTTEINDQLTAQKMKDVKREYVSLREGFSRSFSPADLMLFSDSKKAELISYNVALQKTAKETTNPDAVVWPTMPSIGYGDYVNIERKRRIADGTSISLTGLTASVKVRGLDLDIDTLQGLALRAIIRKNNADTTPTLFKDKDNVDHALTSDQVLEMLELLIDWVESVFAASWVLKAADPPVANLTDDFHWP